VNVEASTIDNLQRPTIHSRSHMLHKQKEVRALKGRCRKAQGASPGKSAHPIVSQPSTPTLKGSGKRVQGANPEDMEAQDAVREGKSILRHPFRVDIRTCRFSQGLRPGLSCQDPFGVLRGGHPDLPFFPGLAPWAFLLDPSGVFFSRVGHIWPACATVHPQCQVCPAASAKRGDAMPSSLSKSLRPDPHELLRRPAPSGLLLFSRCD